MQSYKIIGADQKEYGPITEDQIRQWIAEGRVNGQTVACLEGTQDWKPLEMFPEFGFTATPIAATISGAAIAAPLSLEEIAARDYSLDIMDCISRGWALFKANFGTVFVTFLLFVGLTFGAGIVIQMILAAAGVTHLPVTKQIYFRPISIIFGSLVVGPALGGLFHVYLSLLRGKTASAGELMSGFKSLQDLFLAKLVTSVIGTGCMFPFMMANARKLEPFLESLKQHPSTPPDPHEMLSVFVSSYTGPLPLLLIGLIPVTYLLVNLQFTVPLIIDRKIGFWSAFVTSWKIVHKHWFHMFGLVVVVSLINAVGVCMCCLGLLVTIPLGTLAICYAYEDIFGRKAA
jgi:hypothetical protein